MFSIRFSGSVRVANAMLEPLAIGGRVHIDNPLVLAPLAGHTERAFRGLVRDMGGCGLVVTEMVSSEALTRVSKCLRQLAFVSRNERPVGIQVFGSDPERIGESGAMVEAGPNGAVGTKRPG